MITKTYVYLIEIDGVVKYVGKGQRRRLESHLQRALANRPTERIHHLMIEALLSGAKLTGRKVAEGLTDYEAFALEAKLIAAHDGLWNLSPGGGSSTAIALRSWSDPVKKARRVALLNTAEAKANKSAAMKRLWENPEYRAKVSAARRASWKAGVYNTEARLASVMANLAKIGPEHIEKMRQTKRKRWGSS